MQPRPSDVTAARVLTPKRHRQHTTQSVLNLGCPPSARAVGTPPCQNSARPIAVKRFHDMGLIVDWGHYILAAAVLALLVRAVSGPRKAIRRNGELLRNPPDTLPFVGNGIKFLQSRWQLLGWFDKCQREFGYETLALNVPTLPPGVLIHSPQNLDFVFRNEGLFTKGEFVKKRSWDLFGNGIINADGEFWKLQRKAGMVFLNPSNLRVLNEVALPQYLSESVRDLRASAGRGPVDLQHVFHEITTKLMGKMAYNMEMHADDDFSQSFDFASGATAERFQNPLWPITELLTGAQFRKSVAVVKDFGRRIVASALQDRNEQKPKKQDTSAATSTPDEDDKLDQISGSLIQSLLEAIGDEEMVADAALTYLSAGRDTTGQALTWTFYLLLQHPSVVANIRREVEHVLSSSQPSSPTSFTTTAITNKTQPPQPNNRPTDRIPDLNLNLDPTLFTPSTVPYTMAVFHETLRLFPPIPFEIRQCQADASLPDGTFLPRHSVLVWCLWAMHRSRLTWGEDADAFRPERFLVVEGVDDNGGDDEGREGGGENGEKEGRKEVEVEEKKKDEGRWKFAVGKSTSEFPVFYGGARTCLGRKMAEAIAAQVIPTVVWLFDFERAFVGERISKTSLTLPMEGGLPVAVRTRD